MINVSAQCTVTPLNPTTLTTTGGAVVNGTVNVMIRCFCPLTGYYQNLRWFDTNKNYFVQSNHERYVADSPYFIRSTSNHHTGVILVIPTFNDSYVGTYNCGVKVNDTEFTSPIAAVTLTIG